MPGLSQADQRLDQRVHLLPERAAIYLPLFQAERSVTAWPSLPSAGAGAVHELLHLRIPNRGRVFKALMTAYVPGWQALEGQGRLPGPVPLQS